ncbi:MAG TPA: 3-hydroxyacyl-CoA dehydrogenase NAD-binding domain-containing protein [Candidatus Nanopelagicales bacterium]|nr:3-hydroxyacyl-CoA dehydrogenase NAD-binding domain-containing protein [Candidatus Nanopelagicales bacterium]
MDYESIGVVGAGVMGVGVAQDLAQTGHRVVLLDVSDAILERARRELRNGIRAAALFSKDKKAAPDPREVMERVRFSTEYGLLAGVDFVVENVTEKWPIKKDVYEKIDAICRPEVVFAANTSAIPITRIASATRRAPRVVGMHFMNPVPLKTMVEVIRGFHTTDETLDAARRFLAGMNKECIVVEDSPGFVSNRVLMLTINEAIFLLHDRVAGAAEVDRIFKSCFGHKMGPLETADLIGLDTILFSIEVLHESFNDDKYRPCPLLKKMVDAGLHGRKSGRGFYTYA